MTEAPAVSVVIPHFNGMAILRDCLASLYGSTRLNLEVLLVDNASTDDSLAMVRREFPRVTILSLTQNRGFAGGCNVGIRAARAPLVLILNNDTIHQNGWLELLVAKLQSRLEIAAVQPKIRSYQTRAAFDYSGAAGGEMDLFAYPFARGRIFEVLETDTGQYDPWPEQIFWASGTAFLARREFLLAAGLFDETFFAHMEEIDLQWRLQLMGYEIVVEPRAVIWHRSGYTLGAEAPLKKYLNHRNSWLMFLTNYRPLLTLYLTPLRLGLDYLAVCFSLLRRDWGRAAGILRAQLWLVGHGPTILRRRRQVKALRRCSDRQVSRRLFHGSVALSFYLLKRRHCNDLFSNAAPN